jgi:hypothetical protein
LRGSATTRAAADPPHLPLQLSLFLDVAASRHKRGEPLADIVWLTPVARGDGTRELTWLGRAIGVLSNAASPAASRARLSAKCSITDLNFAIFFNAGESVDFLRCPPKSSPDRVEIV